jgi:SWI/SNF-related matrix-associated actin-dependent regulator 1 of chromatin subfamily A
VAIRAYDYQKESVRDMEDFLHVGKGALLADDMGLGKTLETLWLLCRQRVRPMFPALVVCPANVKYSWEHTAIEHVGIRAQVIEGRTPISSGFKSTTIPRLTIINPDILPSWLPHLKGAGYKTLVLDECQYFANPRAQRTKAAIELARVVDSVLALSGTPLLNAPGELWPTLYMVRPDKFRSLFAFAEEFCCPKREFGRWTYRGARNLGKLHTLLRRTCMVRRLKEDVLDNLPDKVRQVVPMDLTDRAEYDHASTDFVGWLRKHYRDNRGRVQRAARAAAVTRVGYLVRLVAKLKARSVVDWANRFLLERSKDKLVLFGVHTKMLQLLERQIHAKSITVDGSVAGRHRKLAVDQFRKDPNTRVFIGNIRAAGIGIDGLQDVCQNLAFAELWWVPGVHTQAEDRIYRIGQQGVAWINYLVAGDTIEEHLCRLIQTKQETIHATLDGADYERSMDVFDQLIAVLEDQR